MKPAEEQAMQTSMGEGGGTMPAAAAWMLMMSLQRKHHCHRLLTEVCDLLFSSWAVWKLLPVSPRGKVSTPSSFPPQPPQQSSLRSEQSGGSSIDNIQSPAWALSSEASCLGPDSPVCLAELPDYSVVCSAVVLQRIPLLWTSPQTHLF